METPPGRSAEFGWADMDVATLLRNFESAGVHLWRDGEHLRFRASRPLSPVELAELRDRKSEIVQLLDRDAGPRPRDRHPWVPLSFAQERLWFLEQLGLAGPAYNIVMALRLEGDLDLAALEAGLADLVERHEVLRTRFEAVDGIPRQVIGAGAGGCLRRIDLTAVPAAEQEDQVESLLRRELREPFDLERGPVFRSALIGLAARSHILIMSMHHIASDGWSSGVLLRDLGACYASRVCGTAPPAPLTLQYADYAIWQREQLEGGVLEAQLAYWKEALSGVPPQLNLPLDKPRPGEASFAGDVVRFTIDPQTRSTLQALARSEEATMYMLLLGAFQALLSRWTGQTDIVVGSPIAGRTHHALENLVGFFVNTLVLRADLSDAPSFRDLLRQVRHTALEAYAHQELPFEKLVAEIQPHRDLSRESVFQVLFAMQDRPPAAFDWPGLAIRPVHKPGATSKFDLSLFATQFDERLELHFEYATDLFDRGSIEALADQYATLLRSIATDPDERITRLSLLGEGAAGALARFCTSRIAFEAGSCVHERVSEQAAKTPEAIAVECGEERLSYGELESRSNRLAHRLRALGVGPDRLVGLCTDRSAAMVVGLLGILKAGGAYVPLDPHYPRERIAFMIEDTAAAVLVTQRHLATALPASTSKIVLLEEPDGEFETCRPASGVAPHHLAYVIYTSGSTGQPKGALIEHRSLANLLSWATRELVLNEETVGCAVASLSFDIATLEIFMPLVSGGRLVIAGEIERRDGRTLRAAVEHGGVTLLQSTPTSWSLLMDAGWRARPGMKLLSGGELMTRALGAALIETGASVWNLYGPAETTIYTNGVKLTRARLGSGTGVPIGPPFPNTGVYILSEAFEPVPTGIPGEIFIDGIHLARGYLKRPALTAEKFLPNPFGPPGSRIYRSGDMGRWLSDGRIESLGRVDRQIKLRGFRIELDEVESCLLQHPGVRSAVVDFEKCEAGDSRLVAYVVPEYGALPSLYSAEHERAAAELVGQWQQVWDDTYADPERVLPSFAGWKSSYTGTDIPEEEMEDWLAGVLSRIRTLGPSTILEVGSGVGLLVQALAPEVESYIATDLSPRAIERLRRLCASQSKLANVRAYGCPAHDLPATAPVDLAILNSVIQYFPSAEYLKEVLESCVRRVRPGGAVFIGDIRDRELLAAFHTSVQLAKTSPETTVESMRAAVAAAMQNDDELLVSPASLLRMAAGIPEISRVELLLKRSAFGNEMTRFRYDAIIRVGPCQAPAEDVFLTWEPGGDTLEKLRRELASCRGRNVRIEGIPNRRVGRDLLAAARLNAGTTEEPLVDVRGLADADIEDAVDPEAVGRLADELGIPVELRPSLERGSGYFDAVFLGSSASEIRDGGLGAAGADPAAACPDPASAQLWSQFSVDLRKHVAETLPEFMVPAAFVRIDSIPRTANGKVDRRRLPGSLSMRPSVASYVAPRNDVESFVANIWRELLKIDQVGVHDNFFELGGHSLMAMRFFARVNEAIGTEVSIRTIFETPTVEQCAQAILAALSPEADAGRSGSTMEGWGEPK